MSSWLQKGAAAGAGAAAEPAPCDQTAQSHGASTSEAHQALLDTEPGSGGSEAAMTARRAVQSLAAAAPAVATAQPHGKGKARATVHKLDGGNSESDGGEADTPEPPTRQRQQQLWRLQRRHVFEVPAVPAVLRPAQEEEEEGGAEASFRLTQVRRPHTCSPLLGVCGQCSAESTPPLHETEQFTVDCGATNAYITWYRWACACR
jgi:hypothetical protein